jgi:hypothetical protein
MAISKVWQDPKKLGSTEATGLDLRRKFALVTLLISIVIIYYCCKIMQAG